jgi:hypothetical protein
LRVPKDEQLSYQYRDQLPKQHRLASPLPRKHITNECSIKTNHNTAATTNRSNQP